MIAIHIVVGMLGLLLTWLVFRGQDWLSAPYSSYRHTQFTFAAIGAVGWSYCLLGYAKADPNVSLFLGGIISFGIFIYLKYGSTRISRRIHTFVSKLK